MKKAILFLTLSFSLLVSTTHAQDTSQLQLAAKLLEVMEMQQTVEQSFGAVDKIMPPGAAQSEKAQKVLKMMMEELSWKNIKDEYAKIYADVFTADEMKDLIKFYESPAGQAFVKKQPELTQRSMILTQQLMMKIMPKMKNMGQN